MRGRLILLFLLAAALLPQSGAEAKCAPRLVRGFGPYLARGAALPVTYPLPGQKSSRVSLEWFGHAFFRLMSPEGLRVLMDPFSYDRGYPVPPTNPHVVTIGKETPDHRGLEIVRGKPIVLRGLTNGGLEWGEVNRKVGDVRIASIPIMQGVAGYEHEFLTSFGKGAAFLFETGGLCVAHLGDLAAPMNPSQLRRLGRVHVALVVISEKVAMGPAAAAAFIRKLGPNVAIPMHFYDDAETLAIFLRRFKRIRRLPGRRLHLTRKTLPRPTEIVVLRHP